MTQDTISLGDVAVYVDVQGDGPPMLFIAGAGGDADQFQDVAAALRDDHKVVRYDRRANSRSPRPTGFVATTIEEQAADAVALLQALDLAPATVFGNSLGAAVALGVALAAPHRVSDLILHEPALTGVLSDPDGALGAVQPVIAAGMAAGGLRGGAEAFFTFADGPAFAALDDATRSRMLDNAAVLFESEFAAFASWCPDEQAVRQLSVPTTVMVGAESAAPAFREAADWLVTHTGGSLLVAPGGHLGFITHPSEFADIVRSRLGGS